MNVYKHRTVLLVLTAVLCGGVAISLTPELAAQTPLSVIATVHAGFNPMKLAVNENTNTIFALNLGYTGTQFTVIDGATNTATTSTIPGPYQPYFLAVNSNTNKVYLSSGHIYDIATASWSQPVILVGNATAGSAVAVNQTTNKVYILGVYGNGDGLCAGSFPCVQVLDGATNTVSQVPLPSCTSLTSEAIDEATNKIFVGCLFDNNTYGSLIEIDGSSNTVSTISSGLPPVSDVGVNPVTGMVYASFANNSLSGPATAPAQYEIFNESTSSITTNLGDYSSLTKYLNVDTSANQVFFQSASCNYIYSPATNTGICGSFDITSPFPGGPPARYPRNPVPLTPPQRTAAGTSRGEYYYVDGTNNSLHIVNGTTGSAYSVGVGTGPVAVAVNNTTGTVYVANLNSDTISVLH